MSHSETADAIERLADDVAGLKRRGDRFYVERHKLESRLKELAEEVRLLDPERRRRSFRTGTFAVRGRLIPVRVWRSRL